MTERAQNADFRRKPQIFADSPLLLEIQAFGGRRKPQKTADFRRKPQIFAEPAGNRRLGSVTLGASPLARPYCRSAKKVSKGFLRLFGSLFETFLGLSGPWGWKAPWRLCQDSLVSGPETPSPGRQIPNPRRSQGQKPRSGPRSLKKLCPQSPRAKFLRNFSKRSAKNAAKFWRNVSQIFVLQFPGRMATKNFTKNPRHFPRCTKLSFFTAATLGASGPKKKQEFQRTSKVATGKGPRQS